ncbi:hypothetical protein ACFWM3_19205 [Gottfriedia sp. NPDC058432]|uniref:hypothetical protein n=1 Tax=Gottfriedia sp. NPDC058432 TaxID=3346497 RepID=UPI00365FE494
MNNHLNYLYEQKSTVGSWLFIFNSKFWLQMGKKGSGLVIRGANQSSDLAVPKNVAANISDTLIELGFVTNGDELELIKNEHVQDGYANA